MDVTWREETDGRHWTALVDGRDVGRVARLRDFWQGVCHQMRPYRYGWLTRPCDTMEEAQGELLAIVAGRRARWVRPDHRFARKVANGPQQLGPSKGERPVPNSPD